MLKLIKNPRFLFPLFMSASMGLIMSGVMLFLHFGLIPNFFILWMRSFLIAFLVAFPSVFLVVPIMQKLVHKICD